MRLIPEIGIRSVQNEHAPADRGLNYSCYTIQKPLTPSPAATKRGHRVEPTDPSYPRFFRAWQKSKAGRIVVKDIRHRRKSVCERVGGVDPHAENRTRNVEPVPRQWLTTIDRSPGDRKPQLRTQSRSTTNSENGAASLHESAKV